MYRSLKQIYAQLIDDVDGRTIAHASSIEKGFAKATGIKAATKAMDSSGILPPDLAELEWSEIMGAAEFRAYERIAATLELALAAGDLRPGWRGWRLTQQRLTELFANR